MTSDEVFMRMALEEAALAGAAGEVPIGAVAVRDGIVVARARNRVEEKHSVRCHAEFGIAEELERLTGDWRFHAFTLYVTKEPCLMCTGMLLNARIGRVVFGCSDPAAGGCGGAFSPDALPGLLWHFEITPGVLAEESLALLRDFFRSRRDEAKHRKNA